MLLTTKCWSPRNGPIQNECGRTHVFLIKFYFHCYASIENRDRVKTNNSSMKMREKKSKIFLLWTKLTACMCFPFEANETFYCYWMNINTGWDFDNFKIYRCKEIQQFSTGRSHRNDANCKDTEKNLWKTLIFETNTMVIIYCDFFFRLSCFYNLFVFWFNL